MLAARLADRHEIKPCANCMMKSGKGISRVRLSAVGFFLRCESLMLFPVFVNVSDFAGF